MPAERGTISGRRARMAPAAQPGSLARMLPNLVRRTRHHRCVPRRSRTWLAGAIAAGELTPGDRLPTEYDLAGPASRSAGCHCATRSASWSGAGRPSGPWLAGCGGIVRGG